jgi:hypothetical protein
MQNTRGRYMFTDVTIATESWIISAWIPVPDFSQLRSGGHNTVARHLDRAPMKKCAPAF